MLSRAATSLALLARHLERADHLARILGVHLALSLDRAEGPDDALEWTAVLKSCFAFESYQARYGGGVTADRVVECLLLDRALPRSARFAASTALEAVARIEGNARRSKPLRLLIRLNGLYQHGSTQEIAERPREFDHECRAILRLLEIALRETYFHPSKVPASVAGEEGHGMPQQQQQPATVPPRSWEGVRGWPA